jgi:hypothetical protein
MSYYGTVTEKYVDEEGNVYIQAMVDVPDPETGYPGYAPGGGDEETDEERDEEPEKKDYTMFIVGGVAVAAGLFFFFGRGRLPR